MKHLRIEYQPVENLKARYKKAKYNKILEQGLIISPIILADLSPLAEHNITIPKIKTPK